MYGEPGAGSPPVTADVIFEDRILADFEEISSEHIFRLLYIVRNAACCRSLKDFRDDFNQSYWILIFNNFFDFAILEWCKVFGAYSEPTHWTRLVNDHDSFKQGLLARLGLNNSEWDSYGKYIRDYRNNFIAHHKKDPKITNYPDLDNALEAAFYYYEWLLYKLDGLGIQQQPESLKDYYEYCLDQSKRFTEKAYSITKELGKNIF